MTRATGGVVPGKAETLAKISSDLDAADTLGNYEGAPSFPMAHHLMGADRSLTQLAALLPLQNLGSGKNKDDSGSAVTHKRCLRHLTDPVKQVAR